MREVLYRGKRVDNGEWVKGQYIDGYICGKLAIADDENFMPEYWWDIIPETVCQYTGLKDKNGKKIFEGDRVVGDIGNGLLPVKRLLRRIGIVEYVRSAFVLKIINRFGVNDKGENDFCGENVSFGAFGNMEVIGTKFDNCLYKKPDGLCLRESDSENNIYCVEGPCEELFGTKFDVEGENERNII